MITISFRCTEGLNKIKPFIEALVELNTGHTIGFYCMEGRGHKIKLFSVERIGDEISFGPYTHETYDRDRSWIRFLEIVKQYNMDVV